MAFDWNSFLDRYRIEYQPRRRGWLDIWCPFCGGPGTHHIGINVDIGIYHCWHDASHAGKSARRLVAAILGCSAAEAARIVGEPDTAYEATDDTFAAESLRRLGMVSQPTTRPVGDLNFLPEFGPMRRAGPCRALAYPYLEGRGYNEAAVGWLAGRYGLMFAPRGAFAYRIIVPVIVAGRLVNWTGRTVARSDPLRYKSLSSDASRAAAQGLPAARLNIKDTLLDIDSLSRGGSVLVLTEGPFDAMRVSYLGRRAGVSATCLFGKLATPAQVGMVAGLSRRYDRVIALLDRDASFDAFLGLPEYLGVTSVSLPRGVKDPAELTPAQFQVLL